MPSTVAAVSPTDWLPGRQLSAGRCARPRPGSPTAARPDRPRTAERLVRHRAIPVSPLCSWCPHWPPRPRHSTTSTAPGRRRSAPRRPSTPGTPTCSDRRHGPQVARDRLVRMNSASAARSGTPRRYGWPRTARSVPLLRTLSVCRPACRLPSPHRTRVISTSSGRRRCMTQPKGPSDAGPPVPGHHRTRRRRPEPASTRWRSSRSKPYLSALLLAAILGIPDLRDRLRLPGAGQQDPDVPLRPTCPTWCSAGRVPAWWPIPWLVLSGLLTALTIRYLPGNAGHSPAFGFKTGGGPPSGPELVGVFLAALTTLSLGAVLGPGSAADRDRRRARRAGRAPGEEGRAADGGSPSWPRRAASRRSAPCSARRCWARS